MAKFRVTVDVEAFQMTRERRMNKEDWPEWLIAAWNGDNDEAGTLQRISLESQLPDSLEIITRKGEERVLWGDYIVRGVTGELLTVAKDVFELTYEEVL